MKKSIQLVIILLLLLPLLVSCANTRTQTGSSVTEPPPGPERFSPLLDAVATRAPALTSLLVYRDQELWLEQYYGSNGPGTRHEIYSCTKSFVATLIGIAIDKGYISSVDQKVLDFFPGDDFEHSGELKESMTLENVLSMSTGLDWVEGDPAYLRLYYSPDWVKFMLDKPLVEPPGSYFNYCSGCSHLLSAIIEVTTGMNTLEFANQVLFDPLEIENAEWLEDSRGIPIGGWGLHITARQMAKLGQLYLNEGTWQDAQVVSSSWVQSATSTHIQAEENMGYGYQWWIRPSIDGYAALGRDGQMIAVVPAKDLVVVFTSDSGDSEALFGLIEDFLLPIIQE